MNNHLLSIIVCPLCNGKLYLNKNRTELICNLDLLGFPIRHGIPVLLKQEARIISCKDLA